MELKNKKIDIVCRILFLLVFLFLFYFFIGVTFGPYEIVKVQKDKDVVFNNKGR